MDVEERWPSRGADKLGSASATACSRRCEEAGRRCIALQGDCSLDLARSCKARTPCGDRSSEGQRRRQVEEEDEVEGQEDG